MVAEAARLPAGQHACVGIDLHKDTLMSCTLIRGSGEISWRKIPCKNREQIVEFFRALPRPHTVAIESVGFYRCSRTAGRKAAAVAIARKLLVSLWCMACKNQPYQSPAARSRQAA